MSEEYRGKVFKSGDSVALRLPKGLGLTVGTEVRIVREEASGFRVEPLDQPKRKIDLTGIAGALPGLKPRTREERDFEPSPRVSDDWDEQERKAR